MSGAGQRSDYAQIVADLEAEQERLQLPGFTHADAWELGTLLVRRADELQASVTIDIRRHNQILFHCARTGTSADNDRWVERKSSTALHFGESSWLVRHRFLAAGRSFDTDSGLDPNRYAAHGGSVPLVVRGSGVVGAVTVSGLPQEQDHELVVTTLGSYLR